MKIKFFALILIMGSLFNTQALKAQNRNIDLVQFYKQNVGKVVFIKTDYQVTYTDGAMDFRVYEGTGVFITDTGTILTTDHLFTTTTDEKGNVSKYLSVHVFYMGRKYSARLVAFDQETTLATVELTNTNGRKFPVAKFGNASLVPGNHIMTIADQRAMENSFKASIVTKITNIGAEERPTLVNFIISNIGLGHGDSGGPMFNQRGELVGINNYVAEGSSMSGAVMIDDFVKKSVEKLVNHQKIERSYFPIDPNGGWVGDMSTLDQSTTMNYQEGLRKRYQLKSDFNYGVMVNKPMQKDFKSGDVITEINFKKVGNSFQFKRLIATAPPYGVSRFIIWRDGKFIVVFAQLPVYEIIPRSN